MAALALCGPVLASGSRAPDLEVPKDWSLDWRTSAVLIYDQGEHSRPIPSIVRNGHVLQYSWFKAIYHHLRSAEGVHFRTVIMLLQFDCASNRFAVIADYRYGKKDELLRSVIHRDEALKYRAIPGREWQLEPDSRPQDAFAALAASSYLCTDGD